MENSFTLKNFFVSSNAFYYSCFNILTKYVNILFFETYHKSIHPYNYQKISHFGCISLLKYVSKGTTSSKT